MALLSFPPSPNPGDLYPLAPLPGQVQYQWDGPNQTWVLLGTATGVTAGCYGDGTNVASFCVDTQGRITSAVDVPISAVTPDLQTVTTQGAVTTDTIDVGGLVAAGLSYPSADGVAGDVLVTDGAGTLSFVAAATEDLQSVTDNGATTTNTITLNKTGTSDTALVVRNGVGKAISVQGSGNIEFLSPSGGQFYSSIVPGFETLSFVVANGPLPEAIKIGSLSTDINNQLVASGLSYPVADGTADQVLATDGAGVLGWVTTLKVVAPPTASTDPGNPGEVSAAPGFFYFYDGTQWLQVAGSVF